MRSFILLLCVAHGAFASTATATTHISANTTSTSSVSEIRSSNTGTNSSSTHASTPMTTTTASSTGKTSSNMTTLSAPMTSTSSTITTTTSTPTTTSNSTTVTSTTVSATTESISVSTNTTGSSGTTNVTVNSTRVPTNTTMSTTVLTNTTENTIESFSTVSPPDDCLRVSENLYYTSEDEIGSGDEETQRNTHPLYIATECTRNLTDNISCVFTPRNFSWQSVDSVTFSPTSCEDGVAVFHVDNTTFSTNPYASSFFMTTLYKLLHLDEVTLDINAHLNRYRQYPVNNRPIS
ncbi:protein UL116 [Saimiriine betaherpesvirus 4]|uniref:Protein UL116 n=1 Tax=Saimiriine betaherpesvirus 4 TaxID=1535247 RepID=G8XT13_9BETA|nr:protein UL116 [Saimiriine betaherpesvirus 4]AEV80959.1 protein UL116 [Saimiriine betaherpesvirus 4]